MRTIILAISLAAFPLPAMAQDKPIDLSKPEAIASALQEAGYKAVIKKDKEGNPFIESAANGDTFNLELFDCDKDQGCTSAQFFAWYKKKPWFDAGMANRWNANKRFLKVAIDKDGDLSTYMDVSLTGKLTQLNFADVVDWWSFMSGELSKFLDAEEAAASKPVAKPKTP